MRNLADTVEVKGREISVEMIHDNDFMPLDVATIICRDSTAADENVLHVAQKITLGTGAIVYDFDR